MALNTKNIELFMKNLIKEFAIGHFMHDLGNFLQIIQYTLEFIDSQTSSQNILEYLNDIKISFDSFLPKFKTQQQITNNVEEIDVSLLINSLTKRNISVSAYSNKLTLNKTAVLLYLFNKLSENDKINITDKEIIITTLPSNIHTTNLKSFCVISEKNQEIIISFN
jgi:hypothetical protein